MPCPQESSALFSVDQKPCEMGCWWGDTLGVGGGCPPPQKKGPQGLGCRLKRHFPHLQAEVIMNYHVGETVLSLQKTTLIPGGSESLVYTTLSGGIGILVPFTSHEVSEGSPCPAEGLLPAHEQDPHPLGWARGVWPAGRPASWSGSFLPEPRRFSRSTGSPRQARAAGAATRQAPLSWGEESPVI